VSGQKRFPLRACAVCGCLDSKLLYRQSFAQLSYASLMSGYDVKICGHCGFGFADDIPPQSVFNDYYRDLSKYENPAPAGNAPVPVAQHFRDTAELLERFIRRHDSRIFEIGSASGGLLKSLSDRGFSQVLGSDPSPGCVRAARELYGVPSLVGTVFTVAAASHAFDFLILAGVMEHISHLDEAIDRFRRLLKIGGRVYLEVPDASMYQAALDAPFQEFSVEHINFFSSNSLSNLMRARGFRLLHAGPIMRPLHEVTCPCTYAVFEYTAAVSAIQPGSETETALTAYIEDCGAEDARVRKIIQQAEYQAGQFIVWGVGTHTLRLLATGGLDPSKITAFVDTNPKYQHQLLSGIRVLSPAELKLRTEPILISSRSSQRAIHDQIRNSMGLTNALITLY
jgi:SAM-dependent methyltransferase